MLLQVIATACFGENRLAEGRVSVTEPVPTCSIVVCGPCTVGDKGPRKWELCTAGGGDPLHPTVT